jgi:hypothetical protein
LFKNWLKLKKIKKIKINFEGFLSDISGDIQTDDSKEKVLSWKFNSSSTFLGMPFITIL